MGSVLCFTCKHDMTYHWHSGGQATCTADNGNGGMCGCVVSSQ